jgi:hypothetical protein
MTYDWLNDLAALENKDLGDAEREKIVASFPKNRAALDLYAGLQQPLGETQSGPGIPFPIKSNARTGVSKGFVRLFDMRGISLSNDLATIAAKVQRIAKDRLPFCVANSLSLEATVGEVAVHAEIKVPKSGGPYELHLSMENEAQQLGSFEIWENTLMLKTCRASAVSKRPTYGLKPGSILSIRHSSSPVGVGLRVAQIDFEQSDWMGAALCSGLEGNYPLAAQILREQMERSDTAISRIVRSIVNRFEALRNLTRIQSGVLVPVPVARSPQRIGEVRVAALRPLWDAIATVWPSARVVPNPWTPPSREDRALSVPPADVNELVAATVKLADRLEPPAPSKTGFQDPVLDRAWRVLEAWRLFLVEDSEAALGAFRSIGPTEEDPFDVSMMIGILEHLQHAGDFDMESEGVHASSEKIWERVFESYLA